MKRPNSLSTTCCGLLGFTLSAIAWSGPLELAFSAGDFGNSTEISNAYWGLRINGPSTAVYASESDDGCEVVESIVVGTTGTGFFASPYDVDAVVVQDREWVAPECDGTYVLHEDTFDWFAQDDAGNVWYLGEDTRSWDEDSNCLSDGGSWKAGEDEAAPGVVMLAAPRPGTSYRQEYLEGEAEDRAKVLRLNARVSIAAGNYAGCLVTKEYTPLEPGEIEHKFYCRLTDGGPGLALVNELKGKTKRVEYVGPGKPDGQFAPDFPTADVCSP